MSQLLAAIQANKRVSASQPHWAKVRVCTTRRHAACNSPAFVSGDISQNMSELFKPGNRNQLAVGSVVGFATGYAIKKVGQLVLVFVGLEVVALQLMANQGWVIVNWPVISKDLSPHVEKGAFDRVLDAIKFKLPFAGSFTAGCYAGLNWS